MEEQQPQPERKRGFAALDPGARRAIARKGGIAAQSSGKAHRFTPEEAKEAGKKGGEAISRDREHMSKIGQKGGIAAQSSGKAHKYTPEEAEEAGKKGGEAISRDREHMSKIGRKGGQASPKRKEQD